MDSKRKYNIHDYMEILLEKKCEKVKLIKFLKETECLRKYEVTFSEEK